jgi:hypothetical protein
MSTSAERYERSSVCAGGVFAPDRGVARGFADVCQAAGYRQDDTQNVVRLIANIFVVMTSLALGRLFRRQCRRGSVADAGAGLGQSGATIFLALPVEPLLMGAKTCDPGSDLVPEIA